MANPLPGPGEELNEGPTTQARQAATVIVLSGGDAALEVLLVKRNPEARFMGGAWVFPGGSVSDAEGVGDAAHRAAALRELDEEAGIRLGDPAALVPFSRWITPAEVKIRFDTYFYLAPLPAGQEVRIDGEEVVDHGWFTPSAALQANRNGEILLVFPTIKHLEQLDPFATVTALLEHARGRVVEPVQPRVVLPDPGSPTGEVARIVLPGEPGYD
jgi:8-oxo-dGTP pyrophosphatase MutT (NUDIX family)